MTGAVCTASPTHCVLGSDTCQGIAQGLCLCTDGVVRVLLRMVWCWCCVVLGRACCTHGGCYRLCFACSVRYRVFCTRGVRHELCCTHGVRCRVCFRHGACYGVFCTHGVHYGVCFRHTVRYRVFCTHGVRYGVCYNAGCVARLWGLSPVLWRCPMWGFPRVPSPCWGPCTAKGQLSSASPCLGAEMHRQRFALGGTALALLPVLARVPVAIASLPAAPGFSS